MTTLQEAARDALEALERIGKDFVCRSAHHAKKDQHSAFAECPVVVRHTDAIESLRTALAQQGEQQVCAGCGIPVGDVHMSTCKSGKWPSRVSNGDTAAPAPQAQQGEQPIGYVRTINGAPTPDDDNTIFSYGANPYRDVMDKEEWVAVYTAAPAPQAQPMTDPCKTCSHFKEGNLPGVRIHDETCYECRSYWGNKWEAA